MHPTKSFRKATIVALLCLAACAIIMLAVVSLTTASTPSQAGSTANAPRAAIVQNLAPIGSDEDLANQTPIELPAADNRKTAKAGASDAGDLRASGTSTSPAKAMPDNEVLEDSATGALPAFADLIAQPQTSPAASYNVGDQRSFRSEEHEGAQEFTIVCVAAGEGYTLWVDEGSRSSVPEIDLQDFATRLPNIIATEVNTFGDWRANCDVDGDGKAAFVYYPFSGVDWAGFFDESDLYHVGSEEASGNTMDVLHLNVSNQEQEEGLPSTYDANTVLSVIAHEFQHLLFFSQTEGQGEGWLNESFSQAAMSMVGLAESDELDELVYGQMETESAPFGVFCTLISY